MRHRKAVAGAATLAVGLLLSWVLLDALAVFVYFLIWFDIMFLFSKGARNIGIDLTTIVAIMYGIALGPVLGFLFAAVALPLITIVIMLVTFDFDMPLLNIEFLNLGITAGFAGIISPFLPVFATVLLALAFRFAFSILVVARPESNFNMSYYLMNALVSFMVIMAMYATGLLRVVA